ncbi:hypothetical protein QFC24_005573 [Naganishia onofrii]|uniref:Uncharacterized protein n=1 Tax=Naganishia onofrii TaxID=1851511 RepID=A0ACC2X723_9TREE|nr:hypothetical protein QFC24_005573 [Naganishia onofrii]
MATSTPPAKLHGYDFYKSIGSPQYVIAPMVDQSELAWRVLSRQPIPPSYEASQSATPTTTTTTSIVSSDSSTSSSSSTKYPIGGAHLCYTPMIHAKLFAQDEGSTRQSFTSEQFDFTNGEEGSSEPLAGLQVSDRPLFVQGLADWEQIKAVKQAVKIPVFANGNILYRENVDQCLEKTGVDGIMTAEGNLSNPTLFVPEDSPQTYPPIHIIAHHYLDIVDRLKTRTTGSAIKAHLFRILKPGLEKHVDLRNKLGEMWMREGTGMGGYRGLIDELKERMAEDERQSPIASLPVLSDPSTGLKPLPVWAIQPYVRPLPSAVFATALEARGEGAMNDLATGGTGEERIAGLDGTPTSIPISELVPCVQTGCTNTAGNKCDRNACLIHCRAQGGVIESQSLPETERLTIDQAVKLAQGGQLVGKGCQVHEAKDQARKDRKAGKRKARELWKAETKNKLLEREASEQEDKQEKKRKQRDSPSPPQVVSRGNIKPATPSSRPDEKRLKGDASL